MKVLQVFLGLVVGAQGFAMAPSSSLQCMPRHRVAGPTMRLLGGGGSGPFKNLRSGASKKIVLGGGRKFLGGWFSSKKTNNNNNGGGQKPPNDKGLQRSASEDDDSTPKKDDSKNGIWAAYESQLEKNPMVVKALTSFTGFMIGDLLAQFFIEKKKEYDFYRTLRLASFGFFVHGTTSHWFYGMLDGRIPGKGAGAVASKVFIDQVLWNPIFGVMFFSYMGLLEGSGVQGTITKIKRDLMTQVTGSWTVWPLAHAINFRFVPTEQRVLYINTIQIFYNCFLSIIGSKPVDVEPLAQK